jgi:hypothetical protein
MKYWIWMMFVVVTASSCSLSQRNGSHTNSSSQTVDMGKFKGLKIIEIASVNYPDSTAQTQTKQVFSEIDMDNFDGSLIQSLKRSDVRVLPSAQTKVHIDFTLLEISESETGKTITINADVAVSRNGIVTRKSIEIKSKAKRTIGATKDNGVQLFIQELGEFMREQSSFKR